LGLEYRTHQHCLGHTGARCRPGGCRCSGALLKSYHVSLIIGDRYAGEWPRERFRGYGIAYEPARKAKTCCHH
jgi:hypothetical protein